MEDANLIKQNAPPPDTHNDNAAPLVITSSSSNDDQSTNANGTQIDNDDGPAQQKNKEPPDVMLFSEQPILDTKNQDDATLEPVLHFDQIQTQKKNDNNQVDDSNIFADDKNSNEPQKEEEEEKEVAEVVKEEEAVEEPKIVARPSPEEDYIPSVSSSSPVTNNNNNSSPSASSPQSRNGSFNNIVAKIPANYSNSPKTNDTPKSKAQIDTAAPIESVKAAVSKFGGIVDWKAHRMHTVERRKFIELELERAQEEIPMFKKQCEAAEEAKLQVLKELDGTKRLVEELKLNLERAQTEEHQAKQDSELAKLRVEEMEQGIADEASFAAKAQLEVARARHAAAVSDLVTVKDELEQLRKDYSMLVAEKDAAVKKAEEAVSLSEEAERSVQDLTIELITVKGSLESAHAAHLEAEEHRAGAIVAKEQEILHWEKELKRVEEELDNLNQKILSTKDLKSKLDKSTKLLLELKAELAAYMEANINGQGNKVENELKDPEKKTRGEIEASISVAKKDLEEVKLNIEKATSQVNILKVASTSLKSELQKEKSDLLALQQRGGMASETVTSLEAELDKTKSEIIQVRIKEEEEREKMTELPKQLQEAEQDADEAKALAQMARDELYKANEEAEQAKEAAKTMESRLRAAEKEIEASKASEKLALAAINALAERESAQKNNNEDSPTGITLSLEEYYELSKKAHEAEEKANSRVADAISKIDLAKEAELKSLSKLDEMNKELSHRKNALETAKGKADKSQQGKLEVEQELRKWRGIHEQQRKEAGEIVNSDSNSPRTSMEGKNFVSTPDSSTLHHRSPKSQGTSNMETSESSPDVSVKDKKKKKSFFPRIFMFLGRRKNHQSNNHQSNKLA